MKNLVKANQAVEEEPTPYLINALKESRKSMEDGYVSPVFDNTEDAIAWLEDPNARYENGHYTQEIEQ